MKYLEETENKQDLTIDFKSKCFEASLTRKLKKLSI